VEKFPSRVIFVTADKNAKEAALKTSVSILTSSKGEYDVACDYIKIETEGRACEQIPFVVLPHILPDLPVYLVWAEDPTKEDSLLLQLSQFANRLIFDSESTDQLTRFADRLLDYHAKSHCDIADLNWARIESWRELLSRAFYTEERLKQIEKADQITITYNSQETPFFCHTLIQSIYLQAWLASQLGWQLQTSQKGNVYIYKGRFQQKIEVTLASAEHPHLPPGMILSMDLHTADQEHFSFTRNLEMTHQISLQFSTPDLCALPSHYIFSKGESGQSLVKEICHRGTSEHYLKVLNLIKKMEPSACVNRKTST
jgi:glucose-6-phosphate dehydrogenase assembly protein OpcA